MSAPPLSRSNSTISDYSDSGGGGYASSASHSTRSSRRSSLELDGVDITAAMTPSAAMPLGDLFETYFAPRLDLANRKLRKVGADLRRKARVEELRRRVRASSDGRVGSDEEMHGLQEELRRVRGRVVQRVDKLRTRWADAKTVRLRDKICFVVGVMNLVITSLIFALRPHWIPLLYSVQTLYFLPLRVWTYTRRKWHYFLFDFCYYANVLNLLYLWVFPSSKFLFTVCYCAAHGPLAFSIATWRNSLVPMDIEKMASLFIHIFPPLVFMTIRHYIPNAEQTYPALKGLDRLDGYTSFWMNLGVYIVWQGLYYEFIVLRKAAKVKSGERINSYSTLSSGKGAVANLLSKASEPRREWAFMLLQFVYTIVCTLPAPLLFYQSATASATFLLGLLTLSIWNGASYLVEVTFRRFERDLIKLQREVQTAQEMAQLLDPDATPDAEDAAQEAQLEKDEEKKDI
ncbi:hypothetical protein FA09DRAFT_314887 [Tilletiopsis washingtonensis]|uniref:Glycerophosphocholine acyltransferase 1 n=1 Tax=Tilletiopsis washingtonensis TaxID=58919 RepID=A0A316ZFI3_9BASI|nr:hypothetical protein FA09DRAFT_314887 [Tilletiopsis washingtonensis]PWO00282.1 hypothetical protein FA09DRAFT_314887 [Tilletiopsis washingtonensis]